MHLNVLRLPAVVSLLVVPLSTFNMMSEISKSEMPKSEVGPEELAPIPSQIGEVHSDPSYAHDAVFGELTEEGPNYRNVCK